MYAVGVPRGLPSRAARVCVLGTRTHALLPTTCSHPSPDDVDGRATEARDGGSAYLTCVPLVSIGPRMAQPDNSVNAASEVNGICSEIDGIMARVNFHSAQRLRRERKAPDMQGSQQGAPSQR